MATKNLNKAQRDAVTYTEGPLLIVAGAGTGKTTVITEKIAYLVEEKGVPPEHILALTFTEKAAEEMVSRVDDLLDLGYADMAIGTFHTFCERLLQTYGLHIGLPNQFKLMTDTDAWLMMEEHLDDFHLSYYRPLGNPSRHIYELLQHFSKCKDELIGPAEYLAYVQSQALNNDAAPDDEATRLSELANAYHTYNGILLEAGALDFGDLIQYVITLFRTRPRILAELQKKYTHVLVDEFQDVNWAQYVLVQLLTTPVEGVPAPQLTVVGDDDQSIYAFRGASVSNILRFKNDFPQAKEVVLTENYRSGQAILDAAYRVIQHNNPDRLEVKLALDKRLVAMPKSRPAGRVHDLHLPTLDEEVAAVTKTIIELKSADPTLEWSDIAILVRANNHAEPFLRSLELSHIPFEFRAATGLYRQPIVLDCLNFFKIITDHIESSALYRLLRLPPLPFTENDVHKLLRESTKKSISYYETLKRAREFHVSEAGSALADKLLGLIHTGMRQVKTDKPSAILYEFLESSGYLTYLTHEEGVGNRQVIRQIYYLKQWLDTIARFEETVPGAHVEQFVRHMDRLMNAGSEGRLYTPTESTDAVAVLTIHAAKGLEFRHVFVVNLVEDRFPTRRRGEGIEIPGALIHEILPEGDYHIEEERRLFYVAATRAKEGLYLASADDYGGARAKKPSRFLIELGFSRSKPGEKIASSETPTDQLKKPAAPLSTADAFVYELPKAFSFSQVKAYETCPYQYKLAHILKIPSKGNASFSFGQTIHGTLQKFYERVRELNSAAQSSLFDSTPHEPKVGVQVPTLDELLALYDASWQGDWYQNKTQREEYYAKGKEILKLFYAAEEGHWTVPVALESWFKIKVGSYFIHGRIDRIDMQTDGSLEIIDYKTGKSKEKVTGDEKDQLLMYQIATESLPEYRHIGPTGKLTFYYVNDTIRTSFLGDAEELQSLKEKLEKTITAIHAGNFEATPSQFICSHCNFRDLCEYRSL